MSDSERADFTAQVSVSTWRSEDRVTARVLLSDEQLVFASEDVTETVPLSAVFDVAQDVPAGADPDAKTDVTIGFERGESRELATVECRVGKLVRFLAVLFDATLDGTRVILKQSGENAHLDGSHEATLDVLSGGVRFHRDDGTISIARDDLEKFETSKTSFGGQPKRPLVILYSRRDGGPLRTTVCLPSFRYMNLFGRYLQSNPRPAVDSSDGRSNEQYDVLLVDDDPGDLEMLELMLNQRTERLELTTATSAAGGMDAIEANDFDCVVSDYDMPGRDGIDFLRAIREDHPDLPFILFTGQGSEAVAKQAIISDVTDYVEKGVGTQQYDILFSRIRKALS